MNEEHRFDYQVDLSIEDIRLLSHCVNETLRLWPGAPARPVEEQEHLRYMRDCFFRMIMDYNFTNEK